eukprot:TRINITY_DN18684_c0_g1_i2.p2 TRINITY_DN18684_c0_g1~~TRINITY_DN18684_c0_g1_i2.p2  ORF type:complete len:108 (+),score=11.73 TRINITY_DN18684_c0_g1_i2:372-695(+)
MHDECCAEQVHTKEQIIDLLKKTIGLPKRPPPGLTQDVGSSQRSCDLKKGLSSLSSQGRSFCGNCGNARIVDHRFCTFCGVDFERLDRELANNVNSSQAHEVTARQG